MRYGVWTPLPHTIRPEPRMIAAERELRVSGSGKDTADLSHRFAADVVQAGERLGYETTLIAERWLGPDLSAWMLASALAIETSDIELMVALHPGIVAPQQAAKFAASLDRISGGRAAINIVNGWWEDEFFLFSNGGTQADEATRYRRMDEYLQVLRGMWSDEPFLFDGEFYRTNGEVLPLRCVQEAGPRIYAGTRHEPGMRIIAGQGDCWFVNYEPDFRQAEANIELVARDIAYMREEAARHGRKIDFGMSCHVICAETNREADAQAIALEEHGKSDRISFISAKALGPGLVGTPERIAKRIRAYEQAGVGTLMMHYNPMIDCMELFAREVMPMTLARSRQPQGSDGNIGVEG
ncbi:MAG: LLM class flavin-dependent oxidoreductase [Hyphomicrobiales bacterium]|nr:LLM class flavin-dependent oxidoreductase [Hyphomicrobiales bacterium]